MREPLTTPVPLGGLLLAAHEPRDVDNRHHSHLYHFRPLLTENCAQPPRATHVLRAHDPLLDLSLLMPFVALHKVHMAFVASLAPPPLAHCLDAWPLPVNGVGPLALVAVASVLISVRDAVALDDVLSLLSVVLFAFRMLLPSCLAPFARAVVLLRRAQAVLVACTALLQVVRASTRTSSSSTPSCSFRSRSRPRSVARRRVPC